MRPTRTKTAAPTSRTAVAHSAAWAWWGVPAGIAGLAGNLISSHGALSQADAATALGTVARTAYHLGTVLGLVSFTCLLLASAGWRRWGSGRGLAQEAIAASLTVTATLVLFGTGLRGALSEYLPGGINEDNFDEAGLYTLFVLHDTAPWFAWWGVLMMAALIAFVSLAGQGFPRWLGVLSILALAMPMTVMAGSGAVAAAGLVGPIWLAAFSAVVALRGLGPARAAAEPRQPLGTVSP